MTAAVDLTTLIGVAACALSFFGSATDMKDYSLYGTIIAYWVIIRKWLSYVLSNGDWPVYFITGAIFSIFGYSIPVALVLGFAVPILRFPLLYAYLVPIYVCLILFSLNTSLELRRY